MISRRFLLRAAPALILAPAIVRVTSIMPVKAVAATAYPSRTTWSYLIRFEMPSAGSAVNVQTSADDGLTWQPAQGGPDGYSIGLP